MTKTLTFLFFLTAFFYQAQAQEKQELFPCGTLDGKSDWLIKYQSNPHQFLKTQEIIYVPLTIHLVGTDAGTGYFPVNNLLNAFCTLNKDYEQAGIQFYIEGNLRHIAKTKYYDHTFQQGSQMMHAHKVKNTINCYIVNSPAGNCGYSSYNAGIALAKSCMGANDHTWAHEIGHFLSLPHTFYGWEGTSYDYEEPAPGELDGYTVERVDGTFCEFAGDGFCDTPADYLSFRWNCNGQGMSSILQHDPNGVPFRSDGTYFMSYSNDQCMNRFSEEQIGAMRTNLLTEKSAYLYNQTPKNPVNELPQLLSPVEDEVVDYFQSVVFKWDAVPEATHYLLEISPIKNFPFILFSYVVEGTSFTCTELSSNKKYFWRVRPYNSQFTCQDHSDGVSFKTGLLSSIQVIEGLQGYSLYPNPLSQHEKIQISLTSDRSLHLDGKLFSSSGQVVRNFQWELSSGRQTMSLAADGLHPGLYLIRLASEQAAIEMKVVVVK